MGILTCAVDRASMRIKTEEEKKLHHARQNLGCSAVSVCGQLVNRCDYIDSVGLGSSRQAHPRTGRDTVQRPGLAMYGG